MRFTLKGNLSNAELSTFTGSKGDTVEWPNITLYDKDQKVILGATKEVVALVQKDKGWYDNQVVVIGDMYTDNFKKIHVKVNEITIDKG